ncbi:hypothetical protein E0W68_09420 [Flavobacterium salilacus subsp. salilacus]|uniref:hypothetical protein n=1 Tax=Flavobacterium TaxID=237 RepID=UPI001074BF8F|nr:MULTISPECIES: hypothetical protein [Flavobacterium]KAF2518531.1 hypothetical protein E0W68_09420 [Flavobacterium salilacus subsp. salilacus]MBE1615174.1 hypothetical protein [Flavobacterium sp. SaA2.13]
MALLKKIQSATLIETLMATVLIVIVFIVASLILNNLLFNSFSRKTHDAETRIYELEYQIQHNAIKLPYHEEFGNWKIDITTEKENQNIWLYATAKHKLNEKEITINSIYDTAR